MTRPPRQDGPGSWHHVLNRGIARRPLFEDRADVRFFLSRVVREVRRGCIELHAWCLLTTHFHLLVRSPRGELSEAMRRIQNGHSRCFNRRHRRDGTLVRGRFFSKPVQSLTYRRLLVRYIDANPVQARLATRSWEYPWGSARAYVHDSGPRWLERSWIEREVARASEAERFRPEDYARAFGATPSAGAARLVEARIARREAEDDLDDLIHAAPTRVQEWMRRKTALADGAGLGLPVSDVGSVQDAVAGRRAADGPFEVRPRGRPRDGWTLLEIGLLRTLAGLTWDQVGRATRRSGQASHAAFAAHVELLAEDGDYAARAADVAARAVRACVVPAALC